MLDRDSTEVRFNSEWLEMPTEELFRLARTVTAAQVLERDDFTNGWRRTSRSPCWSCSIRCMQGYDSVAVRSDLELGGTDQKFNLLLARDIQRAYDAPQQSVMTMPILPGLDGKQRMSKSLDNYVGVTDTPEDMFGKVMSVPDEAMPLYYRLLLGEDLPDQPPNEAKRALGRRLVERFHDAEAATVAEEQFDTLHVRRELPDEIPDVALAEAGGDGNGDVHLPALISTAFGISSSEARRLLSQGGVKLDGETVPAEPLDLPSEQLSGRVLQVGKRRFARLS